MYILFGCGGVGNTIAQMLGEDSIAYFVDNDLAKRNLSAKIPIYSFEEKKDEMKKTHHKIVLSVSSAYEKELAQMLENQGITNYKTYSAFVMDNIRLKIATSLDSIAIYEKAIGWIKKYSLERGGIFLSSATNLSYPEVSGYFIPTLLKWGYRELALSYAKWLCTIQKDDGSWYDTEDSAPYVFDSAQILKGLLAIRELLPEVDEHIRRGCDWILSNMESDGRLTTPTEAAWGDSGACSELVHIYCLSSLRDAGKILGVERYEKAAQKILNYYLQHHKEQIEKFSLLSHFYAYVMEGLLDMGREDITRLAMEKIAAIQKEDGSVPGYHNVNWVCSTGLFQLALVWFRLGDIERGNRAFSYACKLQNGSGGWYGSYLHPDYPQEENDYFPTSEISWAVKYFLDALYWKNIATFNDMADTFFPAIGKDDGRYIVVRDKIKNVSSEGIVSLKILDAGCGKGRYICNLAEDFPMHHYYAMDISENVLSCIPMQSIEKRVGSLTDIPYANQTFDVVYTCEALEHAVDIESAVREVARVTKTGGMIIVVDKSKAKLGAMEIEEWEQWFDEEELKRTMGTCCSSVEIIKDLKYEGNWMPGLFSAWIGIVEH